jgi:NitT/TauT family transport system ATP-binding protein
MKPVKLKAINVSKTFTIPNSGQELNVLRDVSLEVQEGAFVSIVGPSGCGKTTFLRVVAGLIKATGGKVILDDIEVNEPDYNRGFVFQNSNLYPWGTVLKNILFGLEIQGLDSKASEVKVRELVKLVGLSGFENYYPYQISGGMQQRVNLARALAIEPEILLMDEPFASLDAQTRELMQMELLRISAETKKTVLFVTHQISEAIYLSDQVIVFEKNPGRVKEVIPIDIPKPRFLHVKRTQQFLDYEDHIWGLIEEEVKKAMTGPGPIGDDV